MKDCCGSCKYAKLERNGLMEADARSLLFPYSCKLDKKRGKYYGNEHICGKYEYKFLGNKEADHAE